MNKTNKNHINKQIGNKNKLNEDENCDINENKLIEMELMEEPKPQIYSKLNLNTNNLYNSLNNDMKEKNDLDIKKENKIKVIKKSNNQNKKEKLKNIKRNEINIKDNINQTLNNNSCIYNLSDSNLSSFKDDKSNFNFDFSSDIEKNDNMNQNKKEEKKDLEETKTKILKCKENNKYVPYHKITAKNKNKKIYLKKSYKPTDNPNNEKYKSKEIINKIKFDLIHEEHYKNDYNKTEINDNESELSLHVNNRNLLDEFISPCKSPDGEELFLIKPENILINKPQKDILEKYLKYYFTNISNQSFNSQYLTKVDNYNNNLSNKKIFSPKISYLYKHKSKNINPKNNKLNKTNSFTHSIDDEENFFNFLPTSLRVPFDITSKNFKKTKNINKNNNDIKENEKLDDKKYKKINTFYKTPTNFRNPKLLIKKSYK